MNLGFGDVECLKRRLEENVLEGAERFGSQEYLQRYETERQRHNVPMALGIDFLHKIYGIQNPLATAVRDVGVGMINANPILKKVFADFAA